MASTQIQTSSLSSGPVFTHGREIAKTTSRLWALVQGGASGSDTGLNLYYSDNDGGSWTKHSDVDTAADVIGTVHAYQDTGVWKLIVAWAGSDTNTKALKTATVASNVDTGTPGALSAANTVDAGGANAGNQWPAIFSTDTASNPRVWIVWEKMTAATPTYECRAAYAAFSALTSWATTNFTNLGATAGSSQGHYGTGVYWTVSAADKATIAFIDPGSRAYKSVTFDPTATTPTPGTVTTVYTDSTFMQSGQPTDGPTMTMSAKADYLVFGAYDPSNTSGTWTFKKTVNGTAYTTPTGWSAVSGMGRASITTDGTNFWLVHSSSFGTLSSSAQTLQYREITTSSDTLGGVTAFSDTAGNGVSTPRNTGTSKLYAVYRASTASPYSCRSDFVSIGGAADTTPPGAASVTAAANTVGARIDLTIIAPADTDVAAWEVRSLTSGYPATDRSNGTIKQAETATTANATIPFADTGVTNGTRYYYRVFIKDVSGNWNTGAPVTAVAATRPSFLQRYKADGVTTIADATTAASTAPVFEFQLATANFESGKVANFRMRSGNDNATPPTQSTTDYLSSSGGSVFRYEDPAASGTFVNVPASGLDISTYGARKLRVYTSESGLRYASLRVEQ